MPDGPIAFFLPHLRVGGVEQVTVNLANGLARSGRDVFLLVVDASGPLRSRVGAGPHLVELGGRGVATAIPRLSRFLDSVRPYVLIAAKTHANIAAALAASLARTPVRYVACEHSSYQFTGRAAFRDELAIRMAGPVYRRAHALVAVSHSVAKACSARTGIDLDRFTVIPNPVVTSDFIDRLEAQVDWQPASGQTWLGVGRLAPEKGFSTLIGAFALVSDDGDRLLLLGEGPERSALEKLVQHLDLEDRVTLPGMVPDALPYMGRADVIVQASLSEGFPVTLIEALYSGSRLVATECSSAVRVVLASGFSGSIVAPGSVEGLAEGVRDVLASPWNSRRARLRAEEYSVARIVSRYEDLIADL